MERIEWSEEYSVGVGEIDAQHRQLIGRLNDLLDAQAQHLTDPMISEIISSLAEYIDYHFGTEETYMTRFSYPDLSAHRQEHRNFILKVFEWRKKYAQGETTLSLELIAFLQEWLKTHIRETDKAYSACFIENGLR